MTPAPASACHQGARPAPLPGGGLRLLLEMFSTRRGEARVFTWQMDCQRRRRHDRRPGGSPVSIGCRSYPGLFNLSLDQSRQFEVRNLTLNSARPRPADETGHGVHRDAARWPDRHRAARPRPAAVHAAGSRPSARRIGDLLWRRTTRHRFRRRPRCASARATSRPVRRRHARSAPRRSRPRRVARRRYFDEYIGKTLNVDLNDLSRDRWSLVPQQGDLIAEIRTRRFGNLTYARSQSDAEDVSFFDRRRKKNIAIYPSAERLASRGRFFSEDDNPRLRRHQLRARGRLQPGAAVD